MDEFPGAYELMHGVTLSELGRLATAWRWRDAHGRAIGVPSSVVNGRNLPLIVVAFLIGALSAAGIGVRVIEEVRTDEDATSLPPENVSSTTLPQSEYFVDPDEVLIASTALVPRSVIGTDSTFAIEYELISLAPTSGVPPIEIFTFRRVQQFPNEDLDFIYPRTWTLTTESRTIEGGPANPNVRVARFDLPEGVVPNDVTSVQIIDPLMLYPLDTLFDLSEEMPSTEVIDGVFAELLNISEQGDSSIVQIGFSSDDPIDHIFIEGTGSGWRSSFREAEGHSTVNLTWVGGDLPAIMTFRARGTQWIELEGTYSVSIGRFG